MIEMKTEMKNEIRDLNHEMVESHENHDNNENLENLKGKIIKNQNLKLHLRIKMNIFLKILKSEKLWENNQDSQKSILHFYDIMLNERNHTLIEKQIFGLKENLSLH
jgi:hypothetical protein